MIRVEIRSVGIFFTTKIGNTWIMSVSIHYQRMGDTRSRRRGALDTRRFNLTYIQSKFKHLLIKDALQDLKSKVAT